MSSTSHQRHMLDAAEPRPTGLEAPVAEPQPHSAPDPAAGGGAAVAVDGLHHSFGELEVIRRLDLHAAPGEVVGLVGPSGCGKSTLLELVAGLAEPAAGEIAVGGAEPPAERLARCAYMPQRDLLLPWLRAIDNASLALRNRGHRRATARAQASPLFERLGLDGFQDALPRELSGGMRQRVAFVRTLLADKPVLLLDEPFAGLDAITRAEVQEWLAAALAAEPRTVILVTHDVEEALYLCDRVAVMSARPAHILTELAGPRPRAHPRTDAVTSPEFSAARERAMRALLEGSR
jgi:ABC-type nitrate/sulfonate/bicarbonate transport system ATPase subunit